ncbi:MAG: amylo-alpha-1,6-glucosidase [Candidatus Bipolaricaulia bacterium]
MISIVSLNNEKRQELRKLTSNAHGQLQELEREFETNGKTLSLYRAGIKDKEVRFDLFSRDLLLSALMRGNTSFLKSTLEFAFHTQGTKKDPKTGEEPGKVIHEYQTVKRKGLETRYNACDVTQLTLIGLSRYLEASRDMDFLNRWKENVKSGIDYILRHLDEGLFRESPTYSDAKNYALNSTYWKDEQIPEREEPDYPVVYSLVQAQTISALRAVGGIANTIDLGVNPGELEQEAEELRKKLFSELWNPDLDYPDVAWDQKGKVSGITSDGLHILYYLREGDIPEDKLSSIMNASTQLETPYGFRTYAPDQPGYAPGNYHLGSVWPFEQYFIASVGKRFKRGRLEDIAFGSLDAIMEHGFFELFSWNGEKLKPLGCEKQLWTTCLPIGLSRLVSQEQGPKGRGL